jgi:hypothetical protein
MANFTTDPPVDRNRCYRSLRAVLQERPLTVVVTTAQAGTLSTQSLADRITQLEEREKEMEGKIAVLGHLTQSLHLVCIRTFLDACLLSEGYNTSCPRTQFIRNNIPALAGALGLAPDQHFLALFRHVAISF